jgi:Fur family transcriptional regulator, ferric uptake regulator
MPQTLLKRNYRESKNRQTLIDLLQKSNTPLTSTQLIKKLQHQNIYIHKSTLYRSLFSLKKEGLIRQINSGSNQNSYIWNQSKTSLVVFKCQFCHSISSIEMPLVAEKSINHICDKNNLKITSIDLEISGICNICQK